MQTPSNRRALVLYPAKEVEFALDTDTSAAAFGVVPWQVQDGEEKAIAYVGCASPESRQSYCTTTQRAVYAEVVHRCKKPVSHKGFLAHCVTPVSKT